jgi:molybdate transport system ATP-binding protein
VSALEVRAGDRLRELELQVELRVEDSRCVAIVGPSGAGKSTVLRIVAGLRHPDPGRVAVGGETWLDSDRGVDLPPEERACGFMFQEYALFPHLSAWRNVAFGISGRTAERRDRALELLRRFGVEDLAEARPGSISGGERQRVALARSLARDPSVLLLDEPLSALDTRTRAHAGRELAAALKAAGVPAIVVTHDFAEAALLADEICVMDRGRIVQRGTAAELSARPASAFVADFAGSVVLTGTARRQRQGLTEVELDGGGRVRSTDEVQGPVAVSVFPSPVFISAICPSCRAIAPISCTSKWRMLIWRLPVSRTTAKHSGSSVSRDSLSRARSRSTSNRARNSASESCSSSGSKALISATRFW